MHKFLRAVGFSEYTEKKQIQQLIRDIILQADERSYCSKGENSLCSEFDKNFAEGIGIAVCGEFDGEDNYTFSYYYPYLRSDITSTAEEVNVERHLSKESYAGVCDDPKVGVSLIFYLQNMIPFLKLRSSNVPFLRGATTNLSALSDHGMILMPIHKSEAQKNKSKRDNVKRSRLIQAARGGDEEAIENLTLDDMDTYTSISKRITNQDIYTLVDSYFMPCGVECDLYSMLGEIVECNTVVNSMTKEEVCIMTVCCNDIHIQTCINRKDLLGEPKIGRRFKGSVWLQGYINFSADSGDVSKK